MNEREKVFEDMFRNIVRGMTEEHSNISGYYGVRSIGLAYLFAEFPEYEKRIVAQLECGEDNIRKYAYTLSWLGSKGVCKFKPTLDHLLKRQNLLPSIHAAVSSDFIIFDVDDWYFCWKATKSYKLRRYLAMNTKMPVEMFRNIDLKFNNKAGIRVKEGMLTNPNCPEFIKLKYLTHKDQSLRITAEVYLKKKEPTP
jgi:hypothetical protein